MFGHGWDAFSTDALTGQQWLFLVFNLAIIAGYTFIAIRVLPLFPVSRSTKFAAVSFFILCGLGTHGEMALHTLAQRDEVWGHIIDQWHMTVIHVLQGITVWVFATGFFRDFKRLAAERGTSDAAHV